MLNTVIYVMIYLGSALMVFNIYSYLRFAAKLRNRGQWNREGRILNIPIFLLVLFLLGYLAVGIFGKPDLIVSGILLGGSIFVFLILFVLRRIVSAVQDREHQRALLEAKLQAAEESSRAKTSFLSNMSHEIRTPMNAIIGLDNLALQNENLSADTRDKLEKIGASAHHLLSLINDILDMSRIESGRMELKNEPFSMQKMLAHVNVMLSSQCVDKGLSFDYRELSALEPGYIGDEMKLSEILINILSNAVKYTDAPGTVTFTAEQTESFDCNRTLRFVVRDTGIGMDQEFLKAIFNPFSREDATTTNRYGGTGLGMAITKNLVEMMNGAIDIQSRKGVGTTVTVTVTLRCADCAGQDHGDEVHNTQADGTQDTEEVALAGRCILVVEDVELNAEIIMDLLEMEQMSYQYACNGKVAVEMFASAEPGTFDAILMDLRMPEMDGLTAARTIRELERTDARFVPIIALTANAFEEDVKKTLQAGMNAHLSKPVEPGKLYDTLRACIAAGEKKRRKAEGEAQ